MVGSRKLKLLAQFFPVVLSLLFLICFFVFYRFGNTRLADMFLGAFISMLSIAIVNIFVILVAHESETKAQEGFKSDMVADIVKKTMAIHLGNLKLDCGAFEEVVKKKLEQTPQCTEINILALTGLKFLETLNEADFSCSKLNIFLQNKISTDKETYDTIQQRCATLHESSKIKNILVFECKEETDKLLYGMTITGAENSGIIGFYSPEGNTEAPF